MRPTLAALAALTLAAAAPAGDWPQWLGPNRDGSSPEVVKPWKGQPKVLWRVPVGEGHSSPVAADFSDPAAGNKKLSRVYLHCLGSATDGGPNGTEKVLGLVAATGEQLWSDEYGRGAFTSPFGQGPRATPVVDGRRLYVLGVTGKLRGYDWDRVPKPDWEVDVLKEFGAPNLRFGVSASPLVAGNRLLVAVGGKGASVVAFEKSTGQVAWKALNDPASYASPTAFDAGGKRQAVFLTAEAVVSLDPKTGELYWRYPFHDLLSESSTTPVKIGSLLIVSSVTLGSAGLKLTTKDGKPAVEQAWKNPNLSCYFSTPVAVGDQYVYMVTGSLAAAMSKKPEATLQCVEAATGQSLWSKPKVGKYHAALIRTGDSKLLMLEDTGDLVLIDPDPAGYKELARSKVCGPTWAHPALADGRLYLRDEKELICLQLGE